MGRNYSDQAIEQLKYGTGQVLRGDAFLILLKAMLQSGVAYLGGYPGAPVSGLYDAILDAYEPVLQPLGIIVDASANEASAAAMLAASVDNPIRGAVNWKVVGNNVAADGLAHLSSAGVKGGALVFVGEDYGMDSTAIAERTLPYALKGSMLCIDPKGDADSLARMVEEGFRLSEHSGMLCLYLLRTRTGNLKGSIACQDNIAPAISARRRVERLAADIASIPLPPHAFEQERQRFTGRVERAQEYIRRQGLNEFIPGEGTTGIISHGLIYNTTARALHLLGEADLSGSSSCSFLVLNVIHPLVPEEIIEFLRQHEQVLVVEEGSPNLIEEQVRSLAQQAGLSTRVYGKDILPRYGEYTPQVLIPGLARFLTRTVYAASPSDGGEEPRFLARARDMQEHIQRAASLLPTLLPQRGPTFCAGCPERPVFSLLKLAEKDAGRPYYAADSGCYAMGGYAPFFCQDTYAGMGLGLATGAVAAEVGLSRVVAFMGDGTFWHSGLNTSVVNAVYNQKDAILFLFENRYTGMTGQQPNPSTGVNPEGERTRLNILATLKGLGVRWVKVVNPYRVGATLREFLRAADSSEKELKVLVSRADCMLERQREVRARNRERLRRGLPVTEEKFVVDGSVCREDRTCIRLSGCPAMTLADNPNPLREDPVTTVTLACAGCSLCGELAQTAALCPAFARVRLVTNPPLWRRLWSGLNHRLIRGLFGVPV